MLSETPNLNRCYRALCVPEQRVSPPENPNYARNLKNSGIDEALQALATAEDRMEELGLLTERHQRHLQEMREDLEGERE